MIVTFFANAACATMLVMSEAEIRKELIGPPMTGTYVDGRPWDETYYPDGHIIYHDLDNNWQGEWSFRGNGFCTYYNDEANGGCWRIVKTSENCYEFYAIGRLGKDGKGAGDKSIRWVARGWRASLASTCIPQVGV